MRIATETLHVPALTDDYRISKTDAGFRIVAARDIKKGEVVMDESYEFLFSDVRDGDQSKCE